VTVSPPRPRQIDLLWVALLRVALVPVVLVGERLVDHPAVHTGAFPFLLAAFAVWAGAMLVLRLNDRAPPAAIARAEPFVDLAAITALTYASGGPFSETAMAFFALPVLAATRLRPRVTAGWALGAIAAFVVLSVIHPTRGTSEATRRMISQVVYLGWIGGAATIVSAWLHRRDAALARLASEREQLAGHALAAEQRERRRLAENLHDEAVQTLSLARQELADFHRTGREEAYDRTRAAIDETLNQLRGEIFELHPYVLDHAGLPAALSAIADRCAERTGAKVTVAVDPEAAGRYDELIVVLARELLSNVVKHSAAGKVALTLAADHERIELEVRDDGRGFDPGRREAALLEGHVGLASSEQRLRSVGGRLSVTSAPGHGTVVRATLPSTSRGADAPGDPSTSRRGDASPEPSPSRRADASPDPSRSRARPPTG
jgi:two-component system, NarL family, sensor kinase